KTPPEIVAKANADIVAAITHPVTKERLEQLGDVLVGPTPEGLPAHLNAEMDKWGPEIPAAATQPGEEYPQRRSPHDSESRAPVPRQSQRRSADLARRDFPGTEGCRRAPGLLRARRRPQAADRALPGRQCDAYRRPHHRGGGHRALRRRLARP